MNKSLGKLYLIASPIGNLEDITFRALKTLKEVDEVWCEDTRRSSVLIRHYKLDLKNKLKSFHDHSNTSLLRVFREKLMEGQNIAYLTDGGMPVISDPGFVLVREAVQLKANVEVIPGANAAISLFAMSGLETPKFLFHGFFPQSKGEIEKVLELIKTMPIAHIFYESPKRLTKTLGIFKKNLPQSTFVLGRELTKIHEEIIRGTSEEVEELLSERESVKGECVFAVMNVEEVVIPANTTKSLNKEPLVQIITEEQKQEILKMMKAGLKSKEISKECSKKFKLSRRTIYEFIIKNFT